MDLIDTKILVACLFGVVRIFFGILPLKIYKCLQIRDGVKEVNEKRHGQVNCGLALFQAFGGGVIFATCFLHMMPEVYESTLELKEKGIIQIHYPFSQFIISIGFFMIYFIEEFANFLITRIPTEGCGNKNKNENRPPSNQVTPVIEDTPIIDEFPRTPVKTVGIPIEEKENKENEFKTAEKSNELEQVEALDELMETKSLNRQQLFRGFLVILALSLHSFFEGLAIGLQTSIGNIWYLFVAISIHSATILFVVGLQLMLLKARIRTIIVNVIILSIMCPIGVLLGLLFTFQAEADAKVKTLGIVFLEGLSAGTILYITFFEVLNREKERRIFRLRRASCILLGFGLMACLECVY